MTVRGSEVLTLYGRELRSALRDRTIVVSSIVVPLVLYPLILWAMFSGMAFVRGQTDDMTARVVLLGAGAGEPVAGALRGDERISLDTGVQARPGAEARLRDGDVDALVIVESGAAGTLAPVLTLLYDASRERSDAARRRVADTLARHRQALLRTEALARGVTPPRWAAFAIEKRNAASRREMGAFLLGLLLPILFIVMVAVGCLNPAIDALAGERERGTWETLMTTAASRGGIVTAKFLSVTTLGGLAGLLNIVAMALTMRGVIAPLAGRGEGLEFSIPAVAIPVLVACAIVLAALLAAGMMALSSFARTFREGQSLVMPLYLAAILPATVLGSPGTHLTLGTAVIPVVNVALTARDAIAGTLRPLEMTVAALVSLVVIAIFLAIAHVVITSEASVSGSHTGSLFSFLTSRRGPSGVARKS